MRRSSRVAALLFTLAVAACADSAGVGAGGQGQAGAASGGAQPGSGGQGAGTISGGGGMGGSVPGPQCGDGVCGGGDTCASCPGDCGPCCDGATCCGNGTCDAGESCASCAQDCTDSNGATCPRVGMFYLGWHQPAVTAVNATLDLGAPALTIEDVIRSRTEIGPAQGPVYSYSQILGENGLEGLAAGFYYQSTPQGGPYCLVHPRSPGAINYEPSHEGTYGSGPVEPCAAYKETLARHAAQLTGAGVDFVVTDMTNLSEYDAFSDAIQLRPFEVMLEEWRALRLAGIKTPDLAAWQRLSAPGTMLPHVLALYNAPDFDRLITRDAKTGKKVFFYPDLPDVDPGLVAAVASNGGKDDIVPVPMWILRQAQGSWSFFAPCQFGTQMQDGPCAQEPTAASPVGSQLAVSPSYQLGYASVPFQGLGVFGGLTLRKQFATALQTRPDWLLLSSWNEHIAQPQPGAPTPSMGLETDPSATDRAFVDTYGVEFSRDIEPTEEYGSAVYDLTRSCLRVYRSGATACDQPGEPCCQGGDFSATWAAFDGPGGRFLLYATAGADRAPIYACRAGASDDFFSPDPGCEGTTVLGAPGFVSSFKGGETLRSLRRCFGPSVGHAYALGGACPANTSPEAVLGYVR